MFTSPSVSQLPQQGHLPLNTEADMLTQMGVATRKREAKGEEERIPRSLGKGEETSRAPSSVSFLGLGVPALHPAPPHPGSISPSADSLLSVKNSFVLMATNATEKEAGKGQDSSGISRKLQGLASSNIMLKASCSLLLPFMLPELSISQNLHSNQPSPPRGFLWEAGSLAKSNLPKI
ncbi:hypothetical protein P7K49_025668 [Saguinus oedipus]|uniref:Uncharacterized protein n=1 Tax=Saguinus oedipus TaxID=9490 RepID=A0ABQ9UHT6_SAGOE|nr:hypothetical protein P7K49_025668 [Saguinus oedipus]